MTSPTRCRHCTPTTAVRLARRSSGFALLEALMALLVVAVGLLALGASYMKLARGEDVARQRGEATRLAQEQIESMRGFTQIASGAGVVSWNGLASGNDSTTTNTTYTRTWTLGGQASDALRPLMLEVGWNDRWNEAHAVRMSTVLARSDPADNGALGFPLPANTTLKRPKNRDLNIPVPASDLGSGESAFRLPGTNFAIVFSNDSGYVVKKCNVSSSVTTITRDDLSGCTATFAYVLAGYISLDGASFPSGLSINLSGLSGSSASTCSVSSATDQNTGALLSGYKYYLCVVSVPSSGAAWSGSVRLAAPTLHESSTNTWVCRFQYPTASGVSANQRNVQPYDRVAESLDSQNYVLSSDSTCPTLTGVTTTLHQACSNSNSNRERDCPSSGS